MRFLLSILKFHGAYGFGGFGGDYFKSFLKDFDFGTGDNNILDMLFNPEQFSDGLYFPIYYIKWYKMIIVIILLVFVALLNSDLEQRITEVAFGWGFSGIPISFDKIPGFAGFLPEKPKVKIRLENTWDFFHSIGIFFRAIGNFPWIGTPTIKPNLTLACEISLL